MVFTKTRKLQADIGDTCTATGCWMVQTTGPQVVLHCQSWCPGQCWPSCLHSHMQNQMREALELEGQELPKAI